MNQILPYLYLGDIESASDGKLLKEHNIGAIITILDEEHMTNMTRFENNIKYFDIVLHDSEEADIFPFFGNCFDFIESNSLEHNVLVHCGAGISRSSTVVLSYLMRKLNVDFLTAYDFTRKKRKIHPNRGFIIQLLDLEKFLRN